MECSTCKFWGLNYDGSEWSDPSLSKVTPAKPCSRVGNTDYDGDESVGPSDFALTYPVCRLLTGPDFGCVKYEAKELGPENVVELLHRAGAEVVALTNNRTIACEVHQCELPAVAHVVWGASPGHRGNLCAEHKDELWMKSRPHVAAGQIPWIQAEPKRK